MPSVTTDRRRGINSSAAIKVACIAASTVNLTLSGEQTVDAIALVAGDRCFAKDQTDATEIGIYQVGTSDWQREPDFDGSYDVVEGTMIPVSRGSANADSYWRITNTGTITIGTTSLTVAQGFLNIGIAATTTTTDESVDTTCFPTFVISATGDLAQKTDSQLTYNSATGQLGSTLRNVTGTTDATSKITGASKNAGGAGIAKTAWIGQDIVLDERADHASTSAAGMAIVWVKSDAPSSLMYTDDTAVDHQLTNPVVASHIRAGNTQIWDGATISPFDAVAAMSTGTWETVGPTGSGATNIWTAMDVIPANATILLVRLELACGTTGTGQAQLIAYATSGDSSEGVHQGNRIGIIREDHDVDLTGLNGNEVEVRIPLEPVNQDFRLQWTILTGDNEDVELHYKGFMTD